MSGFLSHQLKRLVIITILIYRHFVSPLKGSTCRFYPTCSAYAISAFDKYGFLRGIFFTVRRLLRCHPFNPGGYDPLP